MRSHIDNISTPDLITVVASEIPLNTTTVFVEANVVENDIMDTVYSVANLIGLAFLNSTGKIQRTQFSLRMPTEPKIRH